MRRRLWNLLVWTSVVLCLATGVIWIRSFWATDFFGRMSFANRADGPHQRVVGVVSGRGGIGFWNSYTLSPPGKIDEDSPLVRREWLRQCDGKVGWRILEFQYPCECIPPSLPNRFGFFFHRAAITIPPSWSSDKLRYIDDFEFAAPCWALFISFAILPASHFGRMMIRRCIARRRAAKQLCLNCGYDMRASPDICPECGAAGSSIRAAGKSGP